MFKPSTALWTTREYKLLILDGHESHAIVGFDRFYIEEDYSIIYTFLFLLSSSAIRYFLLCIS